MQRIALPIGAVVQLNNREYAINKLIGDGATCMVYSASYTDAAGYRHQVNLKECYPYHANIIRDEHDLCWQSYEEQAQCISSFRQAYDKLMNWQNNSTVKAFDMCEANNTLYIVMNADHGQPFDKDTGRSLHELLQTALALTKTVQKYHNNGYLHLDIKPSNFLTIPETRKLVILFDLDTVTAMEDIRSGNVRGISYSDGWTAPEQKQGKLDKICPATDIFAIGAILFEKVMGRQVEPADMSIFADWDFDSELFDDVNPKIKRILRTIFQKTLAANTRRRYQSTIEFAEALAVACEVATAKQFIVAPELQIPVHFIGREQEINTIHSKFQNDKKAVFLHGIGGIGKSTLAVAYALSHKNDYDTVLFCRYKTSLEDLLDDLVDEIQNFEGDTKEGRRKLKNLLDKDTLLIIDNFDVATDKDPYLHQFLKLNAKLLFTSRTDFESHLSKSSAQLEVSALPYKQLESLFSGISGIQINTAEKQQHLSKLLQSIDYHTYITELLARQILSSGWPLETLSRKIEDGLNGLATAEKVQATKDDLSPKQTIPEGLRVLFNLAVLDDHSKQVLRNMYLLDGFVGITKDTYRLFCNSEMYSSETRSDNGTLTWFHFSPYVPDSSADIDVLNELCERGWIQKTYGLYMLHPLVAELILTDLVPCEENCKKLYKYVNAVLKSFSYYSEYDEADAREHRDHFELLCSFVNHIDISDSVNREFAMKFMQGSIDAGDTPVEWLEEIEFEDIITKIEKSIRMHQTTKQEAFEFYLMLFIRSMQIYHDFYRTDVQEEAVHTNYESALCAAKALPAEDFQIAFKRIHSEITDQLRRHNKQSKSFIQKVYKTNPEILDTGINKDYYLEWYELIPSQVSVDMPTEKIVQVETSDDYDELEAWEDQINSLHEKCRKAQDKRLFIQHLYNDSGLEIYQVVACLLEFCENIFTRLSFGWEYKSERIALIKQNNDWDGIRTILDFSEELQKSNKWEKYYDGYSLYDNEFFVRRDTGEPDRSSICDTHLWRIQLAAVCNDWVSFDQLIKEGVWHPNDISIRVGYGPIWNVARTCWNLGECHRILPYLVMHVANEEIGGNFDERENITTFENVVEIAKKACSEVGEESPQYFEYQQIANEFTSRINKITRKRYRLKKEITEQSN